MPPNIEAAFFLSLTRVFSHPIGCNKISSTTLFFIA